MLTCIPVAVHTLRYVSHSTKVHTPSADDWGNAGLAQMQESSSLQQAWREPDLTKPQSVFLTSKFVQQMYRQETVKFHKCEFCTVEAYQV